MIDALRRKQNFKKDNTQVVCTPFREEVILYHTVIYCRWYGSGRLSLTDGGYNTQTTRSRLKAIREYLNESTNN